MPRRCPQPCHMLCYYLCSRAAQQKLAITFSAITEMQEGLHQAIQDSASLGWITCSPAASRASTQNDRRFRPTCEVDTTSLMIFSSFLLGLGFYPKYSLRVLEKVHPSWGATRTDSPFRPLMQNECHLRVLS